MYVIKATAKEQAFIDSYFEAVYFTETGGEGQPSSDAEMCSEFKRESIIDCLSFYSRISCYLSDGVESQAGHDFWLTRNRHGVGFWNRDEVYGSRGQMFTDIAQNYGEVDAVFDWV